MVGICGTVGLNEGQSEEMLPGIVWTDREHLIRFDDGDLSLRGSFLHNDTNKKSVKGDEIDCWVWGEVYGCETPSGYESRQFAGESVQEYLTEKYTEYGLESIERLNGEFFAVVYDRAQNTVRLCTDRLAIRDAYYTRLEDGFAFSTQIQALSRLPDIEPVFDIDMVTEYFSARRTFGVRTPLRDTFLVPPGSILTVDLGTTDVEIVTYWRPIYSPMEKPFSYFVKEFIDRFQSSIEDRVRRADEGGILLSAGSDSRLVLGELTNHLDITAYHMADWKNPEAKTAEQVAVTAGCDFELLTRDPTHHARALEQTPSLSNFVGTFEKARVNGFMDRIRSEVEILFDGHMSNELFRNFKIPVHSLLIPGLGNLDLPFQTSMSSIDDYSDYIDTSSPSYLSTDRPLRNILDDHIHPSDGGINHHDVVFNSPEALFLMSVYTPITNDNSRFMAQMIRQHVGQCSPFLDNRLLDLAARMPVRYFLRRDIVNAALSELSPGLASIPDPDTSRPPSDSTFAQFIGRNLTALRRKYRMWRRSPPQPHLSHGPQPWPDELIRHQSFAQDCIHRHESTIKALPFLDFEEITEMLDDHLAGANHWKPLYRLLTFLEMPVTQRVIDAQGLTERPG